MIISQAFKRIVFIDYAVEDYETITKQIPSSYQIVLLDPDTDGVGQIEEYVREFEELTSIHIISHGSPGSLALGNTTLTQNNLAYYEESFSSIGRSLSDTGDILIYGCSTGAGEIGQSFINELTSITGADIAASDDLTGIDGDWELESQSGEIETSPLTVINYNDNLSIDDLVVKADGHNPSVASLNDGGFVITWEYHSQDGTGYDIYAQRYDALGNSIDVDFPVNTYSTDQRFPSVASLNDGGFVVTWHSSGQDGSGFGVYAQRYDANGNLLSLGEGDNLGQGALVNTYTLGDQHFSDVTSLNNGGFVVTWVSPLEDGSGTGLFGQLYDASGNKDGSQFLINNTYPISLNTAPPSVASLEGGGFIATWGYGNSLDGFRMFGQRFDDSGNTVESEFQVSTQGVYGKGYTDASSFEDGGFIIVWTSMHYTGLSSTQTLYDIWGQRYDVLGNVVDDEFRINTYTADHQFNASVASLNDGGFVVTWESWNQDGSGSYDIYARRYDASGEAVEDEFPVNPPTESHHQDPEVASLEDGGFVITWDSGHGTLAQRFDSNGDPVAPGEGPDTIPPVANDDSVEIFEIDQGLPITFLTEELTSNDNDPDGSVDPATVTVISGTSGGTLTLDSGLFYYDPDPGFYGNDTFTYTVQDNEGNVSNEATVTLTVNRLALSMTAEELFSLSAEHYFEVTTNGNWSGTNAYSDGKYASLSTFSVAAYIEGYDSISPELYTHPDSGIKYDWQGWMPLSPEELGMPSGETQASSNDENDEGLATYIMEDGIYRYFSNSVYDPTQPVAIVARCEDSLVISFRGTILPYDTLDWLDTHDRYQKYTDLINAIDRYVEDSDNGINQVYVTGHSLGGAIAEEFMRDHKDEEFQQVDFEAVVFASPGASEGIVPNDDRISAFEIEGDATPDAPEFLTILAGLASTDPALSVELTKAAIELYFSHDAGTTYHFNHDENDTIFDTKFSSFHGSGLYEQLTHTLERDGFSFNDFQEESSYEISLAIEEVDDQVVSKMDESNILTSNDDILFGAMGDDVLTGSISDNILYGNEGNDVLDGGPEIDTSYGGQGNDTYWVDEEQDKAIEFENEGIDYVVALTDYEISDNIEGLILDYRAYHGEGWGNDLTNVMYGNSGDNVLVGLKGDDWIFGDDGDDTLLGGDDNDHLLGGEGKDTLIGGAGQDTFYIDTSFYGAELFGISIPFTKETDTIKDFTPNEDQITLYGDLFPELHRADDGYIESEHLLVSDKAKIKAQDSDDYLLYSTKKGWLSYDPDGSGPEKAVKVVQLSNAPDDLSAEDLFIAPYESPEDFETLLVEYIGDDSVEMESAFLSVNQTPLDTEQLTGLPMSETVMAATLEGSPTESPGVEKMGNEIPILEEPESILSSPDDTLLAETEAVDGSDNESPDSMPGEIDLEILLLTDQSYELV